MSIFSVCIIMTHGIVLGTSPIEIPSLAYPNSQSIMLCKSLLGLRNPEEIEYKINEFNVNNIISPRERNFNKIKVFYNNRNYGLYKLMDFTTDIMNKHGCQNVFVVNISYEEVYLRSYEYIKCYRSRKPRPDKYHSLAPGGICCIENGAVYDFNNFSLSNGLFLPKLTNLKDLPNDWRKALHDAKIISGYSRDVELYSEIRGPVI